MIKRFILKIGKPALGISLSKSMYIWDGNVGIWKQAIDIWGRPTAFPINSMTAKGLHRLHQENYSDIVIALISSTEISLISNPIDVELNDFPTIDSHYSNISPADAFEQIKIVSLIAQINSL